MDQNEAWQERVDSLEERVLELENKIVKVECESAGATLIIEELESHVSEERESRHNMAFENRFISDNNRDLQTELTTLHSLNEQLTSAVSLLEKDKQQIATLLKRDSLPTYRKLYGDVFLEAEAFTKKLHA